MALQIMLFRKHLFSVKYYEKKSSRIRSASFCLQKVIIDIRITHAWKYVNIKIRL